MGTITINEYSRLSNLLENKVLNIRDKSIREKKIVNLQNVRLHVKKGVGSLSVGR